MPIALWYFSYAWLTVADAQAMTERQHATSEEELAALLAEAARHGSALEASAVVERPNAVKDSASLWVATLTRALALETRACDEAKAEVAASEAKVKMAWTSLMEDKAAVDQSRVLASELKVHHKHGAPLGAP